MAKQKNITYQAAHKLIIDRYIDLCIKESSFPTNISYLASKISISRPTMYAHFKSIEELEDEILNYGIAKIEERMDMEHYNLLFKDPRAYFTKLADSINERDAQIYKMLIKSSHFFEIIDQSAKIVTQYIKSYNKNAIKDKYDECISEFFIKGELMLFFSYFDKKNKYKIYEIAETCAYAYERLFKEWIKAHNGKTKAK